MEKQTEFIVEEGSEARLDVFLTARMADLSRAQIQRLIEGGYIAVDGQPRKANYKLRVGETVKVSVPPPQPTEIAAEEIPLDVVYEDGDILVVNKPKGMTTHPAPGSPAGTLVNAILAHCKDLSGVGGVQRPGIVHRLDKDTSGLIVVAKNDQSHLSLQKQISDRTAGRHYLALVWGNVPFEKAVVDAPIGRHPVHRQRMAVIQETVPGAPSARKAVTEFHVVERLQGMTLLEAKLLTGRTHQVRVHCSFMGHPVVGDPVYNAPKHPIPPNLGKLEQAELHALLSDLHGQALHAARLSFTHPKTGEEMDFEAPAPESMKRIIEWMKTRTV
ncbi:MAG: RluA family pseudouridine synthase [Armatimonadota bacterium]|nr:RluA family pseudouridine synthase [Armatimonadota bacterium]